MKTKMMRKGGVASVLMGLVAGLLLWFHGQAVHGQCGPVGISDWGVCHGDTLTIPANGFSGGIGPFQYNWTVSPGLQILSGQGTPNLQVVANGGNPAIATCYRYDVGMNCTGYKETDLWFTAHASHVVQDPIAACPSATVLDTFVLVWLATVPNGSVSTLTWVATGGTIVSQNRVPFGMSGFRDTLVLDWNGSGPQGLDGNFTIAQVGWAFWYCYYTERFGPSGGGATITGPAAGCDTTTNRTYSETNPSGYTFNWTATNGTIVSGQGTNSVSVRWHGNGLLTVVKTGMSCAASFTDSQTFTFSPAQANLGPDQNVCSGVVLQPGSFTNYLWSTGATTPSLYVPASGTYSVTCTNAAGCQDADTVTLTIGPTSFANLGPNQTLCAGVPVTLNPGAFQAYSWSTGATSASINVTASGNYAVTVTDANGCTDTDTVTVTFNPAPAVNLGPNPTGCMGSTVTLNAGSFASYAWSTGATSQTIGVTTGGVYSVTVTHSNGCQGSDSVAVTFAPVPSFSLGADSFVCADTSVSLDGPAGMSAYAWSTGATSANIVVGSGGTYVLTVTDANGCTATDNIVLTGLTDCVFPGDANYDGVADNVDVLSIGAYYGYAATSRAGATTQWYGQFATNWGGQLPGQADPKHSDCDGNGLVAAVDTQAVALNYGRTHTKAAGTTGGPNVLKVVALQDTVLAGDVAWFRVDLGDGSSQVDSAYGVAFTLNHSTLAVAAPGLLQIDYANCWFAGTGSRVDFTRNAWPLPEAAVAVVRNDQVDQQGFGEVCTLGILTDSNMTTPAELLIAWLTDAHLVNAALRPQTVLLVEDTTVVVQTMSSAGGGMVLQPPQVFPNPAGDWVRISAFGGGLRMVEVFDLSGKRLLEQGCDGENTVSISTASLAAGTFLLKSTTEAGAYFDRLVVAH